MTGLTSDGASYSFDFDRHKGLMRITIRGFWTADTVTSFIVDGMAAMKDAQRTHAVHDTLVDARDFPVQAAQISDQLTEAMRIGAEMNAGRAAVISQNQLGKMQGDRLNPSPRNKTFLSEAEAIAWLAEPQQPPNT